MKILLTTLLSFFLWSIHAQELPDQQSNDANTSEAATREDDQIERSAHPALPENTRSIPILTDEGERITGTILDESGEPVPYSSVALNRTSYGVIADENGVFSIRIANRETDTLLISNVAYHQVAIALHTLEGNQVQVILSDKVTELEEVVVSPIRIRARKIVNRAIERIPDNYIMQPFAAQVFHQRWSMEAGQESPVHVQHILDAYYPNGYELNDLTPFYQVSQGRKAFITEQDSAAYSFYSATASEFTSMRLLDLIQNRRNSFLNSSRHVFFKFYLDYYDSNSYEISFFCDVVNARTNGYSDFASEFRGKIFIDSDSYAITKIETEFFWDSKDISGRTAQHSDDSGLVLLWKTVMEYAETNGQYHLAKVSRFERYAGIYSEFIYYNVNPLVEPPFDHSLFNTSYDPDFEWNEQIQKATTN